MDAKNKIKPLLYYVYINGNWQQIELPIEVTEMRVGSDADNCEIQMDNPEAAPVQVLMKRVGEVWHFIETGDNPMMKVNGLPKRQSKLEPRSSLIIQIGDFIFIFATKSDKLVLHQTTKLAPQFGPPQDEEFGLKGNNQELRYAQNSLCIIGSSPLCDFNIPTKVLFCGFIYYSDGNFLFNSLVFNNEIKVSLNGLSINEPVTLKPGNMIVMDTYRVDFSTPGNNMPVDSNISNDTDSLALIQIDEHGEPQKTYKLPVSGSSIYVGRSKTDSHIVIEGSRRISRKHAQLVVFDNKVQVVDIGSKNGLLLNDEEITNNYAHPGDLVTMGDLSFLIGFA